MPARLKFFGRVSLAFHAGLLALVGLVTANAQSSVPGTVTADLRYEEVSSPIYEWSSFDEQKDSFKTEPKDLSAKIFRGNIKFRARNRTLYVPYLWDCGKAKLYIDANGNGDLTDDTSFPAVTPQIGRYHSFKGIHVAVRNGTDLYEQAFDATFWNYSNSVGLDIATKSCWLGRVSLQGSDWQVGVLEGSGGPGPKGNGWLLLRPWADHAKPFTRDDDALSCVFLSSTNLFLGQQAYQISCRYLPGTPPKYQIDFTPREANLGSLQLTGKSIERLVLNQNTGERFTSVLDKPEGTLQVPVGTYQQTRSVLAGNIQAQSRSFGPESITIASGKVASFNLGGPLTNTVSVSRRGSSLVFGYTLKGNGGKLYSSSTRATPPRWIVYRGDKQIASGDFEFG